MLGFRLFDDMIALSTGGKSCTPHADSLTKPAVHKSMRHFGRARDEPGTVTNESNTGRSIAAWHRDCDAPGAMFLASRGSKLVSDGRQPRWCSQNPE